MLAKSKKSLSKKSRIEKFDPGAQPQLTEPQALAQARQLVINCTPQITNALCKQAAAGSYLHARMLFDFIGLTAAATSASAEADAQLTPIAKLIAEELGFDLPVAAAA